MVHQRYNYEYVNDNSQRNSKYPRKSTEDGHQNSTARKDGRRPVFENLPRRY